MGEFCSRPVIDVQFRPSLQDWWVVLRRSRL
jgi:hypothetical protein